MKSLDTNILIYATNQGSSEHLKAYAVLEALLQNPSDWIVSDQVVFEYLRALTNSLIFAQPMSKNKAVATVKEFREMSGARFCCYEGTLFNEVLRTHHKSKRNRLYDILLAETLKHQGVEEFYTRNVKDFQGLGFNRVVNPID